MKHNRAALTAEQRELARAYIPLARAIAKSRKRLVPELDGDLDSAAMLAIVEAAQSFEPERGVKFATFARYRIEGALRYVMRLAFPKGYRGADVDRDEVPLIVSGHRTEVARGEDDAAAMFESKWEYDSEGAAVGVTLEQTVEAIVEGVDWIESYLRKLPKRHAATIRAIYLEGASQTEAAAEIGRSKSRVSYLHAEALAMIKEEMTWQETRILKYKESPMAKTPAPKLPKAKAAKPPVAMKAAIPKSTKPKAAAAKPPVAAKLAKPTKPKANP